jgi:hypothetical protein
MGDRGEGMSSLNLMSHIFLCHVSVGIATCQRDGQTDLVSAEYGFGRICPISLLDIAHDPVSFVPCTKLQAHPCHA